MMAQAVLSALIGLTFWMPCSAAPSAPVRLPIPESEWGSLIGDVGTVSCTPVVETGRRIICLPISHFPGRYYVHERLNQIFHWIRHPSPGPVECRVSLHTNTVDLPNRCHEEPGSPRLMSCEARIPESLLNLVWCEITGVTDVMYESVEWNRHERCDRECDKYTVFDTCEFSKECSDCLTDFHLFFPGAKLEKGLCKMTKEKPAPASGGINWIGDVSNVRCKAVEGNYGTECNSEPHLPSDDYTIDGFYAGEYYAHDKADSSSLTRMECRVSLDTNTVAVPNRCHKEPGIPWAASCEATIPTFLRYMAKCELTVVTDVVHGSPRHDDQCICECDQYNGSDTCVFSEECDLYFINFHRFFPGVEHKTGFCVRTPVAQVPPGRDLVNLTDTPAEDDGVPLSAVQEASVGLPIPASEWGDLIGGVTFVTCTPVVKGGKIYCQSFPHLPNQRPDWTRLPNPDQVECRVSLHTSTVSLPNDCREVPGTPGFISCEAKIPGTLLTIARCEMTGVTDIVPGSVKLDRHERCDRECDQYTASDTCVFSEECAVCLINFHRIFPGIEPEKGLCKMTLEPQAPLRRDLVNVTCSPVEEDGFVVCRSNYDLVRRNCYSASLPILEPVQCRLDLERNGVALPTECQEVPSRPRLTRCTTTIPRSLLVDAHCGMHRAFGPKPSTSIGLVPLREECHDLCKEETASDTCVFSNECAVCLINFHRIFPGVEPEKGLCKMTSGPQVPPGRDLVNVTCSPVEEDGLVVCRSNFALGRRNCHSASLPELLSVKCRVELEGNGVVLPNKCQEVPSNPMFTRCTSTMPRSLLAFAHCEISSNNWVLAGFPARAESKPREACDHFCKTDTAWGTCVPNSDCTECIEEFRDLFTEKELMSKCKYQR